MRHVAALWRQQEGENRGRDGGSVLHDSRRVVTRRSWRKESWRWGWWETGSFSLRWLCSYWGTFFPITAGHIMHSEAIRSVISWWSLQDILTCTVLKEGVNHSRQTKPNLTATLYCTYVEGVSVLKTNSKLQADEGIFVNTDQNNMITLQAHSIFQTAKLQGCPPTDFKKSL